MNQETHEGKGSKDGNVEDTALTQAGTGPESRSKSTKSVVGSLRRVTLGKTAGTAATQQPSRTVEGVTGEAGNMKSSQAVRGRNRCGPMVIKTFSA